MSDVKYCYPDSDVLINKLNITDNKTLFEAEKQFTLIRLQELQENPIKGNYDFDHLRAIHKYIFQDLYNWAGKVRTVEIGKGNLFCTTACIQEYATCVFDNYYPQCYATKDDLEHFIKVFAKNYGDLNALHPFREGNGRAQREFARMVCLKCGYDFDLSCTRHKDMLNASILSFDKADNSAFEIIFSKAITPHTEKFDQSIDRLSILTLDDLIICAVEGYDYYEYGEHDKSDYYDEFYKEKIKTLKDPFEETQKQTSLREKLREKQLEAKKQNCSERNNKNNHIER